MRMTKPLNEMTLEELWELFPIVLEPHNGEWAIWFAEEKPILQNLCPNAAINHIGSTAIPEIMAKPTVDILVEFSTTDEMSVSACRMEEAGYIKMSDAISRISLNKGYTPYGYADMVFHIHLRLAGDNTEIHFRDYLISHPDTAKQYESLKEGLAERYRNDRDAYTEGKTEFIEEVLRLDKGA